LHFPKISSASCLLLISGNHQIGLNSFVVDDEDWFRVTVGFLIDPDFGVGGVGKPPRDGVGLPFEVGGVGLFPFPLFPFIDIFKFTFELELTNGFFRVDGGPGLVGAFGFGVGLLTGTGGVFGLDKKDPVPDWKVGGGGEENGWGWGDVGVGGCCGGDCCWCWGCGGGGFGSDVGAIVVENGGNWFCCWDVVGVNGCGGWFCGDWGTGCFWMAAFETCLFNCCLLAWSDGNFQMQIEES